MTKISFFMDMLPPTTTHQTKKAGVNSKGKIFFYESGMLKSARQKLAAHLAPHAPDRPLEGPVQLLAKWLFPIKTNTNRHNKNKQEPTQNNTNWEWRTTKPDTDNLQKLLKDVMTDVGFWRNDAQVCSEIVQKVNTERTGIYIEITPLMDPKTPS